MIVEKLVSLYDAPLFWHLEATKMRATKCLAAWKGILSFTRLQIRNYYIYSYTTGDLTV